MPNILTRSSLSNTEKNSKIPMSKENINQWPSYIDEETKEELINSHRSITYDNNGVYCCDSHKIIHSNGEKTEFYYKGINNNT